MLGNVVYFCLAHLKIITYKGGSLSILLLPELLELYYIMSKLSHDSSRVKTLLPVNIVA